MSIDQPSLSLYLTKSRLPKSRYFLREKLQILALHTPVGVTLTRVDEFQNLFAFRRTGAIITKAGQGPRDWTKLSGIITTDHIVRHLQADLIPTQPPRWVGARSLATSLFFCIDVDSDLTKKMTLADECDKRTIRSANRAKNLRSIRHLQEQPSFQERCQHVESALRRLGIDPNNPRHVLIQRTPRGGRHYYVFLDKPYHLTQSHDLLKAAGLNHKSGQIELYPSESQGLRLPFGYLPDTPHDPTAWIQFIDDYRNRRIRRFSLAELDEHLGKHHACHAKINAARQARPAKSQSLPIKRQNLQSLSHDQASTQPDADDRYDQLLNNGITSFTEADELQQIGIRQEGTRTEILKLLASHLIWHKHLSAEEANNILTDWAMNPRHASKDIQHDLTHGTQKVAKQISTLCNWCEQHKRTNNTSPSSTYNQPRFAPAELTALERSLESLPKEVRQFQAEFFLSFLSFAKCYGKPAHDQTGWEAAPAINQVIRKWRGCHHMYYKDRIGYAITTGTLTLVQNSWHSKYTKGRARKYRLIVPVVSPEAATLDYESALKSLTCSQGNAESTLALAEQDEPKQTQSTQELEYAQQEESSDSNECTINNRTDTADLRPSHPRISLEPSPRECHPQSDEASGVHHRNHGTVRCNPSSYAKSRSVPELTSCYDKSRPVHDQISASINHTSPIAHGAILAFLMHITGSVFDEYVRPSESLVASNSRAPPSERDPVRVISP